MTFIRKVFRILFLNSLLTVTLLVGDVLAQVPTPSDDEVNRIAGQLFCPICDNMSLDVCPIEACREWRELIRSQLAEGWTEGDIKDYFVAQYGDRVLGEPPLSGLNWLLYLAPPIIILVGFSLLFTKMRRQPQGQTDQLEQRQLGESGDPYLKLVEQDLRKLKEN